MIKNRMVIIAGATALVLAAGGGAAYAASASIPDSAGVIHGCYKTPVPAHGTPLSVIDSNARASCPAGSAALNWRQAGGDGMVVERQDVNVPFGQQPDTGTVVQAIAHCPSGYVAVGGGYGPSGNLTALAQEQWMPVADWGGPDLGNAWLVWVTMEGTPYTGGGSWTLSVFVNCLPTAA
jgi:hypothetical protein